MKPRDPMERRRLKVGFVLLSPAARPIPSTRVAVTNILPALQRLGIEPHVLFEPEAACERPVLPSHLLANALAQGLDVVAFQKVHGPSVQALARALRAHGVRTVFQVCDLVDPCMADLTDATVVVTDYLRSLYPAALQHKVFVVHDGIEQPQRCKTGWRDDTGSWRRPLQAILVTSAELGALPQLGLPPPWLRVTVAGRYAPRGQWLLRLRRTRWAWAAQDGGHARARLAAALAHPRIARVPWHPQGVYDLLSQADIGVIPVDADTTSPPDASWRVKSENRLTLKMAMGLPVVATPIPAYESVVEHGVNGFLARSPADWQRCLRALRDPELRRDMGQRARVSVLETFSMPRQAQRLADALWAVQPPTQHAACAAPAAPPSC